MDPITLSAIIAGGSALVGTGANAFAAGAQNKKSRAFSREMYARQLADNLAFWEMQNRYNTPAAQVQRLKEAGLNKALMFGNSASAGNAGSLSAPSALKPEFNVPDFSGISEAGNAFANRVLQKYDREIKMQQAENMRKQNQLLEQQMKLTEAETRRKEFDLNLDIETRPTSVASRQAQLEKLKADLKFTVDSNDRAAIQTASNIQEATERILTARLGRGYTELLMKDIKVQTELKKAELSLRKQGVSFGDNLFPRLLLKMFGDEILPAIRQIADGVLDFANKPFFQSRKPRTSGSW